MVQIQASAQLTCLEQLVANALVQLADRGFADRSIKYYKQVWDSFIRFAASSRSQSTRVNELDTDFLAECGISPNSKRIDLSWSQDVSRRGLRILREIQESGQFHCHEGISKEPGIPLILQQELERYEKFCIMHRRHRTSTVANHRHVLNIFLRFLAAQGISAVGELQATMLNAFICERSQQIGLRALATQVGCVRSFLRFLSMEGIVSADLVAHARALRFPKEHRLPPIWSSDAVEQLLDSVDRTSNVGKRDYAILLLAARMGLRASDIRGLQLENIQWAEDRLTLTQSKTGCPLTLPLGEEIGQALIDYLRDARPCSPHRHVFLKVRAPHDPVASTNPFYGVMSSALRRSGVAVSPGMPRGLHSLRHTLATALVTGGQSLESVAGVLGHRSIESTRIYTHLDQSTLSSVALDPEEALHE